MKVEMRIASRRLSLDEARRRLRFADSYSRMDDVIELCFAMQTTDWYTLLGEEWTGCDNIGLYRLALQKLVPSTGPVAEMMSLEERSAYDSLPDRLTLYRGCGHINKLGASWSLDRTVAARFPYLNRYRQKRPILVTAEVSKAKVLAVKLDRAEVEVITFAARRKSVEDLPAPT